jgi:hypothetical protein
MKTKILKTKSVKSKVVAKPSKIETKSVVTPTDEQLHCVALCKESQRVKINAVAGSGKTSTLMFIAKELQQKSLYVAFNKVTALEAEAKFPKHVTCRTTHSIAYSEFGRMLQHKLSRPKSGYVNVLGTGSEIAKGYGLESIQGYDNEVLCSANTLGMYVRQTVDRYEQSADDVLAKSHIPFTDMEKLIKEYPSVVSVVVKWASKLWTDRYNIKSNVLCTHDTYLKLYQLSKPVLPYDIIYLDECQDSNACVLDIVLRQTSKLVLVGDKRQAIYGWRGAVNAMEKIICNEARLSKSFRYGQAIADIATIVLNGDMKIIGNEKIQSIVGEVNKKLPYMYLFRTNSELLSKAVRAVDNGENVSIEIDVKDFIKLLESATALSIGDHKNVKHEKMLAFKDFGTFMEDAKIQGGELQRLVRIIEQGQARHMINVLSSYYPKPNASVIYTTAHKSKGREHEQVILADDFPSPIVKGEYKGLSESETNLLYVAITRAQKVLQVNSTVDCIVANSKNRR